MTSIQQKLSEALKRQGVKPPKAAKEAPVQGQIVTISLADVQGQAIQWFWPNRIPAGMLSLLVGNPGRANPF